MKLKGLSCYTKKASFALTLLATVGLLACSDLPQPTEHDTAQAAQINPDVWPSIQSSVPKDLKVEKRVATLLAKMTVEEKVGQIIQANIGNITAEEAKQYNIGSVLNGGGHFPKGNKHATAAEWAALADDFYAASTDKSDGGVGIPLLWGSDAVHGHNNMVGATIFPHNIGLGAANEPLLMREIGEITAKEVRASGLDWTFAPTLAVVRDDRWGRTYESYSETPEIVAAYAKQVVEGIQGVYGQPSFMDEVHLLANAKHFIGDGGTYEGKDQGDNRDSEQQLFDIHGKAYAVALEAGVQIVMASFSSWKGDKLTAHKALLTDVLKEKMGFDGFVISDWNAHASINGCTPDVCAEAINAGIDMIMAPVTWKAFYHNTLAQVTSGKIKMTRLNDAVTRILRVKARSGLFDQVKPSARAYAGDQNVLGAPAHRAVAREAVRKSLVLLKNNQSILPLNPKQNVLVLGDGADDIGKQSGGWTLSWQGTGNTKADFPNGESIYEGIAAAVTDAGGHVELASTTVTYTRKPDVAILVYGEDPYAEFQGDKKNLLYVDQEQTNLKLLKELKAQGIPVVSVFLTGRPLWVNPYLNASEAFVVAWLPGTQGGGVADVVFTQADGSIHYPITGALSFSWPKTALQFALNSDIQHGYDPLFAQGYGLRFNDKSELAQLSEDSGIDLSTIASEGIYFKDGRPLKPWVLTMKDNSALPVVVEGGDFQSTNHALKAILVDRHKQGDSRQFVWTGKERASASFNSEEVLDISRQSRGGLGFGIQLRVDALPKGELNMSMSCGEGCQGVIPLTPYLSTLPVGQWAQLNWPLTCFEAAGVDMSKVNGILTLEAQTQASISVNDIRIVTQQAHYQPCP